MEDNKENERLRNLIDILWEYVSEKDIPEINKRLEETEKGE